MTAFAAWLQDLGLENYARCFADNGIDFAALPYLTDEDLKELGVLLGHRRKLLAAIAELAASPAATAGKSQAPAAEAGGGAAERRQLTVMFSDLVGSTALSARLDPEDMGRVIQLYQQACAAAVARYDGFVAQYSGDGVLAYFGYPLAHEDDAERAARAGLEITTAVAKLETRGKERLQARVGIATGLVVVGDLIGEGAAQQRAVVGDTPNLAARLQALAEPGSVVVAKSTRRLLSDVFRLRDLGSHPVKGLTEPVAAWAVAAVSAAESRFDATRAARSTGFVGRRAEGAVLLDRLRQAWRGEGQMVLISGEAGIGKSRLAAWLAEQVTSEPHTRLRYQCSPYHQDSALYPFIQQLERAAQIKPEDDADRKLDQLEALLRLAAPHVKEIVPLFASLLSIPTGGRYPALGLSPTQQRRQTLAAMLDQLEGLARSRPMLWLLEDAHWADATTLELLDLGMERLRRLPVLVAITFRPEFEPPWQGLPNVTHVALGRLDRGQVEALIERVTDGRKLPAEVIAHIVAKTDGVPLFVEELTKHVQESGLLIEEGGRYRLDRPLPPLAIPSTLQDSLMARLDRLAPVKEVAQIGAAIGREFSYALLSAVVGQKESSLRAALARLEKAELLFRSGGGHTARYRFKHALVQEAAYESLLKSRRQVLHLQIAEALRDKFPSIAGAEPELLAHHFAQAGLIEPAIEWSSKAGNLALRRSAFKEAIGHLGKAIEMSETLAGTGPAAPRSSELLKLHVAYGNAIINVHGHGAPETTRAFLRARELAAGIADAAERSAIYYGIWSGNYMHAELAPMRDLADAFLRDVAARPAAPEAGVAHRIAGVTCWVQGDYVGARRHYERALAVLDRERDRDLAFRFAQDPFVVAESFFTLALWPLGEVDAAAQLAEAAVRHATEGGQIATIANAHFVAGLLGAVRHDARAALPHADRLLALSRAHDLALYTVCGMLLHGWAEGHAGDRRAGIAEMRRGLALLRENRIGSHVPFAMTVLAELEADAGAIAGALATLDDAAAEAEQTGQRWYEAETHRVRGTLLLRSEPGNSAAAELAFRRAVAVARAQKTRSFELRAALDLAKLYCATGRGQEARAVLAPALRGFSATPDFPETQEAQSLLASASR